MMQKEKSYRAASFVLRIWWEQDEKKAIWRGRVQHAATGHASYFRHVADLLAFIETHTGPLENGPDISTTQTDKKV
jgi:hypothetical protein